MPLRLRTSNPVTVPRSLCANWPLPVKDGNTQMEAYAYGGREFPSLPVTDIPPLPEAALYALSVARRPGVSAGEVARALGAVPVITTASDVLGQPAVVKAMLAVLWARDHDLSEEKTIPLSPLFVERHTEDGILLIRELSEAGKAIQRENAPLFDTLLRQALDDSHHDIRLRPHAVVHIGDEKA